MEFKTELHCHTSEVSACGSVSAADLVEEYIGAGYTTVVITDHFSEATFAGMSRREWEKAAEFYLSGFRAAREAAGDRLNVLLGMELRFDGTANDYLVYGMREEFILSHPEVLGSDVAAFSRMAEEEGFLLYQAHPFRNDMTVVRPNLLYGVEVHNGNPRHDSRNGIARAWAEKFGLHMVGGSDYHEFEDLARGGIVTAAPVATNRELLDCLTRNAYTLIECGE